MSAPPQRRVQGISVNVYNVPPNARPSAVHRVIRTALIEGQNSNIPGISLNFNLQVLPHEGGASRFLRGILTFPSAAAGSAFLQLCGGLRPRKSLSVCGQPLRFLPSANIVPRIAAPPTRNPPAQDRRPARELQPTVRAEASIVRLQAVQFGWECRDGTYSVEYEIPCAEAGSLIFDSDRREFRVQTVSTGKCRLLVIHAAQVLWAAFGQDGSSDVVAFFSLHYPPTYESLIQPGRPRKRDIAQDEVHALYAPFIATSVRLQCHGSDLAIVRQLFKTAQVVYKAHAHRVAQRALFAPPIQQAVLRRLRFLPFEVAFQLERMSRDSTMDLREVLSLCPVVADMLDSSDVQHVVDLLRSLSARLMALPEQDVGSTLAQCLDSFVPPDPSFASSQSDRFQCYHVIVTPSTILLDGPFLERKNRVLRTYPQHSSHFLRVIFAEEGGRLQYRLDRDVDGRTFIHRRVGGILNEGLTVGGRHFQFLAYSQSGLKSHSVWFMRPFDIADAHGAVRTVTPESIIGELGTFTGLTHDPQLMYCPARWAARISQAFTATEAAITMDPEEIFVIPDEIDETGKRSFTDGVGTMSSDVADEMWIKLQLQSRKYAGSRRSPPRAFQIRFMGAKGMLSVDHNLPGRVVCIRPSMEKFLSEHREIEVASVVDKPGEFCLNRPLIMLLEGLGAAGGYTYFKELQDKVIKETKEATKSLDSSARVLDAHGLGTAYRLSSVFLNLFKLGLDVLGDPFVRKILRYAVYHILRELKHHARIPVPGGYTLVGVADVHGYLKENEVFACVLPTNAPEPIFLEGAMMIARSPVIHPGDVQVVRAIGRPPPDSPFAVERLTNTVVFSINGYRPLASKLAGGDLDGDCFVCTTVKEMIPRIINEAADYNPAKRKTLKRPATTRDVTDFVTEYIYSDNIGKIATAWLVTADRSPSGIWDKDCLALAELHSDAADYPKTGMPVPLHLIPRMRFKERPDWNTSEVYQRGRDTRKYYKSTRWIGKLYREVELPSLPQNEHTNQRGASQDDDDGDDVTAQEVLDTLQSTVPADSVLSATLQNRMELFLSDEPLYDVEEVQDITNIFKRYVQELVLVCYNYTINYKPLEEEEVVAGTISAKTSQPRMRKDRMSQMRERSTDLVVEVRAMLAQENEDEEDDGVTTHYNSLRRAWIAYTVSTLCPDKLGSRSFQLVALGQFFEAIKAIEDAHSGRARDLWA